MKQSLYSLVITFLVVGCSAADQHVPTTRQVVQAMHGHGNRFTLFETGQVRPIALSPNKKYLYAVNTPDNRLEIFEVENSASNPLEHVGSVIVGLEPVAVAAPDNDTVWVVNHLSDSVSIVDTSNPAASKVRRTLLVGDEPRDIVFAGNHRNRAFITTAHRGQNNPNDPQLTTPGIGRADVWVFAADEPGSSPGGNPLTIVTLFTDTPRALAVSGDGRTVYAAGLMTGNRTTSLHDLLITNGGASAPDGRGLPPPNTNFQGIPGPEGGIIVQFDGSHWVDNIGRYWDDEVRFNLPDKDVFAIDATANPPAQLAGPAGFYASVGTILYNMAVNPVSGKIYVSNTDAHNEIRFSGPGTFAGTTVQGRVHESRITVLDAGGVHPRHLNKHVDFDACCAPIPNAENDASLALPLEMAVSSNGQTLYLAAFGSSKIGIFDTAALENDTFVPSPTDHIEVSGGGPSGLALDESRHRLYVLTRFDNSISVIDTVTRTETKHLAMFNPEPASVVAGRSFFYDARFTSSNGTTSCASCHVFGDFDSLAWDLGAPDDVVHANPGPFNFPPFTPGHDDFHPLKGPMTTQSLRGLANHGPMHWRGDRTGSDNVPMGGSAQPDTGLFDENIAFNEFNEAFVSLNGRNEELTAAEMQTFTDFILQITYPPNPIRNLDGTLTASQQRGKDHFENAITEVLTSGDALRCTDCHVTDRNGNAEFGVAAPGFFGTDGLGLGEGDDFFTPENGTDVQHLKVPHLRNLYQKVGMFGNPEIFDIAAHADTSHQGDQVRGVGFLHDGSLDTVFRFMQVLGFSDEFSPEGFGAGPEGDPLRRDVEQFMLAFDSNLFPVVGQQISLDAHNGGTVGDRIDLLIDRASQRPDGNPECELVVTSSEDERSYLYLASVERFLPSEHGKPWLTDHQLRALAHDRPLTYTCVPPGSGYRIGLDADLDGCFNTSEQKAGYDPRDPGSKPHGCW